MQGACDRTLMPFSPRLEAALLYSLQLGSLVSAKLQIL
jgi:hypothetical protein